MKRQPVFIFHVEKCYHVLKTALDFIIIFLKSFASMPSARFKFMQKKKTIQNVPFYSLYFFYFNSFRTACKKIRFSQKVSKIATNYKTRLPVNFIHILFSFQVLVDATDQPPVSAPGTQSYTGGGYTGKYICLITIPGTRVHNQYSIIHWWRLNR